MIGWVALSATSFSRVMFVCHKHDILLVWVGGWLGGRWFTSFLFSGHYPLPNSCYIGTFLSMHPIYYWHFIQNNRLTLCLLGLLLEDCRRRAGPSSATHDQFLILHRRLCTIHAFGFNDHITSVLILPCHTAAYH